MTITPPPTEKPLTRGPWTCKPCPGISVEWKAGRRYVRLDGFAYPEDTVRDWVFRNCAAPFNLVGANLNQNQLEAWAEFRHTLP